MARKSGKKQKATRQAPASKPDRSGHSRHPIVWGVVGAALVGLGWLVWSSLLPGGAGRELETFKVEVLRSLPHDPKAFTQGLLWHDGKLYESVGRYGVSGVRRINPENGQVELSSRLASSYFGEGLSRVGDRLIQLTWKENTAFVYDISSLQRTSSFSYTGEGWGLCYDGRRLVMSDGSDRLIFRDPDTFEVQGRIYVTLRGQPLSNLNELECVDGQVYANVWERNFIVRIDPESGFVNRLVNAGGLLSSVESTRADVLNGIAFNPDSKTFYITGKLWPRMFEVRFLPTTR